MQPTLKTGCHILNEKLLRARSDVNLRLSRGTSNEAVSSVLK